LILQDDAPRTPAAKSGAQAHLHPNRAHQDFEMNHPANFGLARKRPPGHLSGETCFLFFSLCQTDPTADAAALGVGPHERLRRCLRGYVRPRLPGFFSGRGRSVTLMVGNGTLSSIQYLRGIAATMVVYHHARDRLPSFVEALPSPIGQAGVDLFFVISGFIMVVTTWSKPATPGLFLARRLVRIAPIYWIYTTALALIVLVFPSALRLEVTPSHYLYSILFIPHSNPVDGRVEPLLQLGWTLNYEMFFYCVFAATLMVSAPLRAGVTVAVLSGLVAVGWMVSPASPVLLTYTSPLLLEFALGAVIGQLFLDGSLKQIGTRVGWMLIAVGIAIAVVATEFVLPRPVFAFGDAGLRLGTYGVAASLVVLAAAAREYQSKPKERMPLARFGKAMGDASYTLYLSHLFTIGIVRIVWLRCGFGTEGVYWALAFVAVAMPASLAAGWLAYVVVEHPMTRTAQKWLQAARSTVNTQPSRSM
jgi:exopolysaccharide production protein ExoZ